MRLFAIIVLSILTLCNTYLLIFTHLKKSRQLVEGLTPACAFGNLVSISMILLMLSGNRDLAFSLFTVYYLGLTWLCYFSLKMGMGLSGAGDTNNFKNPFFYAAAAASIAEISNMTGYLLNGEPWLFTLKYNDVLYSTRWAVDYKPAFYVILGLFFLMMFLVVLLQLIMCFKAARIYRPRYLVPALVYFIGTMFYVYFLFADLPHFVIVIILSGGEALVIAAITIITPQLCVTTALEFLADKTNDGVVLYDSSHKLQLVTDSFLKAFDLKDDTPLEEEAAYWDDKLSTAGDASLSQNGLPIISMEKPEGTFLYEVNHTELSENGKPVGCVYWIGNVTESIRDYEEMRRKANFDDLTGIYNERHFIEKTEKLLAENPFENFILVTSDVENFRSFKANFGQQKADEYLTLIAYTLDCVLEPTTKCVYGRTGDDNFSFVMRKAYFDMDRTLAYADSVTEQFHAYNFRLRNVLGVYDIVNTSMPVRDMINCSLIAAGSVRHDYTRSIGYFDESIQKHFMTEQKYNSELSEAIREGQLRMYLQPQVDPEGRTVGSEALVRWLHPTDGLVPPCDFVPFFEQNGRITEIDMHIWRCACEKLKEWAGNGHDDLYISVNISAKDLYSLDIYETFINLVKEYGINPRNLKLEITESAIINNLETQLALITRLQEAGFEVEMDDFGSAYSSFNMLKDICVNVLKIDMKFLGQTENIDRSKTILETIIGLSKKLDMRTVAEGVETSDQVGFLHDAGCDTIQGYYYSRPIPVEEFERKYL